MNVFLGRSEKWLKEQLEAAQEAYARATGSQTGVALAPGLKDDFSELSLPQLEAKISRLLEALNAINPDAWPLKDSKRRMVIRTEYAEHY